MRVLDYGAIDEDTKVLKTNRDIETDIYREAKRPRGGENPNKKEQHVKKAK